MVDLRGRTPEPSGIRPFLATKYIVPFLFILVAGFTYYATGMLLAVIPENHKQCFIYETHTGDTWNISLTHSVERTLWEEYFVVDGPGKMTMTHTTFESLGWGFPYSAADGKLTHRQDGRYELVMNRPFSYVPLRISVQAMQHFHHGTVDLDLCSLYGQGTRVDIRVLRRYQYWLYGY